MMNKHPAPTPFPQRDHERYRHRATMVEINDDLAREHEQGSDAGRSRRPYAEHPDKATEPGRSPAPNEVATLIGQYVVETINVVQAGQIARYAADTKLPNGCITIDGKPIRWALARLYKEKGSYAVALHSDSARGLATPDVSLLDAIGATPKPVPAAAPVPTTPILPLHKRDPYTPKHRRPPAEEHMLLPASPSTLQRLKGLLKR